MRKFSQFKSPKRQSNRPKNRVTRTEVKKTMTTDSGLKATKNCCGRSE